MRVVGEKDTRSHRLVSSVIELSACVLIGLQEIHAGSWRCFLCRRRRIFLVPRGEEEMRLRIPQRTGKGIRVFTVVAGVAATYPEDHVILRFQF